MEERDYGLSDYSTEAKANMRGRVQRRNQLLQIIKRNGKEIGKDHLLGVYMIRVGVSQSTTYQYLNELKMARIVMEHNGNLLTSEDYEDATKKNIQKAKELTK